MRHSKIHSESIDYIQTLLRLKKYMEDVMRKKGIDMQFVDEKAYVNHLNKNGGQEYAKKVLTDNIENSDMHAPYYNRDFVLGITSVEELAMKLTIRGY